MSFLPFPRFPPKIRQKIWQFTLKPRIICLYMYDNLPTNDIHESEDGDEGGEGDKDADEESMIRTLPITTWFDCVVADACPSDVYGRVHGIDQFGWTSPDVVSGGSTRAPPALFICRESRTEALKRYVPAFPSVTVAMPSDFVPHEGYPLRWNECEAPWEIYEVGQGRIWVDFESDVIVVDAINTFDPLGIISIFALEESTKISKLCVGAYPEVSNRRCDHVPSSAMTAILMALNREFDYESVRGEPYEFPAGWCINFNFVHELLLDPVWGFNPHPDDPLLATEVVGRMVAVLDDPRTYGPADVRIAEERYWEEYL
jgi:hypothetical protein